MNDSRKYPLVSAKAILRYKNCVLMLKHPDGKFDFPGGKVRFGESVLQALHRELKEELNYIMVQKLTLFDVWDYIPKDNSGHVILIHYFYELPEKPEFYSPEDLEIHWMSKIDMKKLNIVKNKEFRKRIFTFHKKYV